MNTDSGGIRTPVSLEFFFSASCSLLGSSAREDNKMILFVLYSGRRIRTLNCPFSIGICTGNRRYLKMDLLREMDRKKGVKVG